MRMHTMNPAYFVLLATISAGHCRIYKKTTAFLPNRCNFKPLFAGSGRK